MESICRLLLLVTTLLRSNVDRDDPRQQKKGIDAERRTCALSRGAWEREKLFLSKLNASEEFKGLLKEYIEFANEFRHAADPEKPKPTLTEPEVEFFVYITGAFIRMTKESRSGEQ